MTSARPPTLDQGATSVEMKTICNLSGSLVALILASRGLFDVMWSLYCLFRGIERGFGRPRNISMNGMTRIDA